MFKNYLLIGYRNLLKTKLFTIINILGLALSLTCALLILFFVYDELTYDHYHEQSERIVRLSSVWHVPDNTQEMVITSQALGSVMKEQIADVEAYCRFEPIFPKAVVKHNGHETVESSGFYTSDSHVFDVFTFRFLHGDGLLNKPGDMVIAEKIALKYFGKTDVLGQILTVGETPHIITGVYEDFPGNIDFQIHALLYKKFPSDPQWLQFSTFTYVLINPNTDFSAFTTRLDDFANQNYGPVSKSFGEGNSFGLKAQKLRDIHFSKPIMMDSPKGNITLVQIFIASGIFLLIIAIFNFLNLTTIRAIDRTKEVGIRKSVGAGKGQLVAQFLVEYAMLVIAALLVALTLLQLLLPEFNTMIGKQFHFGQLYSDALFWSIFSGVIIVPLLVSIYPGLVISRLNTSLILKGKFSGKLSGIPLYKSLIFLQFVVSGVLVMGIFAVHGQMAYIENKDLGYDATNIAILDIEDSQAPGQWLAIRNTLNNTPEVKKASLVGPGGLPASGAFFGNIIVNHGGADHNYMANMVDVDEHYTDMMGMEIVQGQSFSEMPSSMHNRVAIVNEAFVKMVGWQEAIGQFVQSPYSDEQIKIVGVVRDFHYNSLHSAIEPIFICWRSIALSEADNGMIPLHAMVKLSSKDATPIKSAIVVNNPQYPLALTYLDDKINGLYAQEQTMMVISTYFTSIAILISCMGLFGLSQYLVQLRTKEIGIRKVLGASLLHIVSLLSGKFVVLVVTALLCAVPLAWWGIDYWLHNFAYHIDLEAYNFLLPAVILMVLAMAAIGMKAYEVACGNPVESLRDE